MKLYVTEGSAYALMARVVVREKGLGSRVEIIAARMRLANSSYYGINPSGRVSVAVAERGLEVTFYLWHSWPGTVIPIHPRPAIPEGVHGHWPWRWPSAVSELHGCAG